MNENVTVVKEFTFDAAHFLPGYDGPCANIHGHTYKLQIGVKGEVGHNGMVIDFNDFKKLVEEKFLSVLDHSLLNSITGMNGFSFPHFQPTAERMVLFFANAMTSALLQKKSSVRVAFVRLWETPTSYAEWRNE